MKFELSLSTITITYKPTGEEIFKSATPMSSDSDDISSLAYKINYNFSPSDEHRELAEANMVMYDGELNVEGYDELSRFISYVDDLDFLKVTYDTKKVEI